jgi:hypothetical protein
MLTATVCVALSGAGLATALLTAWRRRFRAATRLAAVSLLPIGLYLAGLITLGGKIGTAVGGWAADLVLKPTVWIGFAVLAFAVVLYLASRLGRNRAGRKAATASDANTPVTRGATAAEIAPAGKKGEASKTSEFDDVEAILRKHGI